MTAKNDITGDEIKNKEISESYRQNFEKIFGVTKKEYKPEEDKSWTNIKEEK